MEASTDSYNTIAWYTKMSLLKKRTPTQPQTRISAKRVSEILGCAESTVFNGGAGTKQLTRIRNGKKQLRFLEPEVIALALQQEEISRESPR
jgi:hypothetical protein